VSSSGLHYSGRLLILSHRGENQLEYQQQRHQAKKSDGRYSLGTYLQGKKFTQIVLCVPYNFPATESSDITDDIYVEIIRILFFASFITTTTFIHFGFDRSLTLKWREEKNEFH